MRPSTASRAASTHAPARVRTHSTLGLTFIANDQSLRFLSFMHTPPRCSHRPRISRHARRLSFSTSGFPPFSWPAVLSFFLLRVASAALSFCLLSRCAARHACPQAKTRSLARTPAIDGRRRDVRSEGMADWETARGDNTERTLTAAAPPPPRDPYRQALAMRPSLKARPLVS